MFGSPTNLKKSLILILVLLVAAAGLFWYLERQKHKKMARFPGQNQKNLATGLNSPNPEANAEDDSEDGDNEDDGEDDENARVVVCGPEDQTPVVRVSNERFLNLLRENSVWQTSVGAQACYKRGQSATLMVFKAEGRIHYEVVPRGKVIIDEIEEIPLAKLGAEKKYLLTHAEEKAIRRAARLRARRTGEKMKDIKIKMVHLKSDSWFETKKTYGAPILHPMARTLDLNEMKAAMAQGHPIYDIRPKEVFDIKSIPGAANTPANEFGRKQFILQSPAALKEMGFGIDQNSLPKKKNSKLIIFSSCGGDFLSYNAITFLRSRGYKKIEWFRGGLESWLNVGCGTPDKVEGLKIVEAEEVKKYLASKAIFIYVQEGESLRKYKIPGSLDLQYRQKYFSDSMAAFRKTNFNLEEFKKSGDEVDLSNLNIPKDKTIVVYGRYDYDWRAPKLAQMLKLNGYKSVVWYRMGLDDWLNHALFRPQEFATTPAFIRE